MRARLLLVGAALPALSACGESPPRNQVEAAIVGDGKTASTRLSEIVSAHKDEPKVLIPMLIGAGFSQTFSDADTGCRAFRYTRKVNPIRTREGFVRLCPDEHVAQVSYRWF